MSTFTTYLDVEGFRKTEAIYRRIHHLQGEDPWIPVDYKMPPDEVMVEYKTEYYTGRGWWGYQGWCGKTNQGNEYHVSERVNYWRPIIDDKT